MPNYVFKLELDAEGDTPLDAFAFAYEYMEACLESGRAILECEGKEYQYDGFGHAREKPNEDS